MASPNSPGPILDVETPCRGWGEEQGEAPPSESARGRRGTSLCEARTDWAPNGAPIRRGAAVCVPNGLPKSELLIRAPADHRCCQLSASNGGSSRIGPAATTAAARARAAAGCLPSPKPDARPAHVETRMKSPRQGGGLRGRSFKFAFLDNFANRP